MVIIVNKEELIELLDANIEAWMHVDGGPNFDAFEFDPNLVDREVLDSLGYYSNRSAWISGVMVKKLQRYKEKLLANPVIGAQNS